MRTTDSIINDNITLLAGKDPKAAVVVSHVRDSGSWHWCVSDDGKVNLQSEKGFLYCPEDIQHEVDQWYASLDLQDVDVLYIYGIGLGYYYFPLESWLAEDEKRYLVFIEDDVEVLRYFCETDHAKTILSHDRVMVKYLKQQDSLIEELVWFFTPLSPQVTALVSYQKNKSDTSQSLLQALLRDSILTNYISKGDLFCNQFFFYNMYRNFTTLSRAHHGNQCFGKLQNVPVIICGAGPSLHKHFNVLNDLKDKALLVACGSAANALASAGIRPHVVFGLDPTIEEYYRFATNECYEVPLVYRLRLHPEALDVVDSPRVYISGEGWHSIEGWIEEQIGLEKTVCEEGYSVSCFAAETILNMRCSPIIFVGLDLAYTGLTSYAAGVAAFEDVAEMTTLGNHWNGAIETQDINGEKIYSRWRWIVENNYLADLVKKNNDTLFINATEGGLGIEGMQNMTLAEATRKFLRKRYDWQGFVHAEIQQLPFINMPRNCDVLHQIQQSFESCDKLYQQILDTIAYQADSIKNKKEFIDERIWIESLLESEIAYTHFLSSISKTIDNMLARNYLAAKNNSDHPEIQKMNQLQLDAHKNKLLQEQTVIHNAMLKHYIL